MTTKWPPAKSDWERECERITRLLTLARQEIARLKAKPMND